MVEGNPYIVIGTCMEDCRKVHEGSHMSDTNGKCDLKNHSWGMSNEIALKNSECNAWKKSVECLSKCVGKSASSPDFQPKAKQCCGDAEKDIAKCMHSIQSELCKSMRKAATFCGGLPASYKQTWKDMCGGKEPT